MEQKCTNCQEPVTKNFCANCGQSVKSRRGPIWRVLGELTEDVFTFDSKFYKSIFSLFCKPGHLTQEFVAGKRAAILPPVRMYLVVSLIFFLIFQIESPDVSESNVYIGDILLGKEAPNPEHGNFNIGDKGSMAWLSDMLANKREELEQSNPQIIVNRIFNALEKTLPNALILFLPLFALFMKMLYLFKRVLYFDHLLFILHFQTWLMCWVMITYGLALINPLWSILSAFVLVYLAMAQKRFYKQTYALVIPKTFFILFSYASILLVLGLASLFFSLIVI
jgi:hypothetical protein